MAASDVHRGQAIYTPLFLKTYDVGILGFSCRWVWRCPKQRMLAHYDRHVGARHADVGVGTGYFLDKASWPGEPTVSLVDLNANSLAAAARRIRRFAPATTRADILQPLPELPHAPFDSIGVNFLLHCLPGTLADKAGRVFEHLAPSTGPETVVFGSTILAEGVRRSPVAKALMAAYNRRGILQNKADSLDDLTDVLDRSFTSHTVEVVGCVALFTGVAPLTIR